MDVSRRRLIGLASPAGVGLPIVINVDSCLPFSGVMCRSCDDLCEPHALSFRPQLGGVSIPEIDMTTCTGCGDCLPRCPQGAIGRGVKND